MVVYTHYIQLDSKDYKKLLSYGGLHTLQTVRWLRLQKNYYLMVVYTHYIQLDSKDYKKTIILWWFTHITDS